MLSVRRSNTMSSYNGPDHFYPQYSQSAPSIADRSYYSVEPKQKQRFGSCVWISVVLFILFILILIICLIVFFTWKPTYAKQVTNGQNGPQLLVYRQPKLGNHRDLLVADALGDMMRDGSTSICLLDTLHFSEKPTVVFLEGHLPNSRHFDIDQVLRDGANSSQRLVAPLQFQAYVRSLGLTKNCHIVAYDHGEVELAITSATFVWWIFKVYGFERISVLNGGLEAWRRLVERNARSNSFTLASGLPGPVANGNLIASWNSYWLAELDDVLNALGKRDTLFLDSRPPSEFRSGRIVGAVNMPTLELLTDQGALKTLPELKQLMAKRRIFGDRPMIVYGSDSIDASALYFVVVQAGYNVKLYEGGWSEFGARGPLQFKAQG
uniref:Sulfurtransferase n=1 Tax=Trichuris muris TaxID=70415 RepID=A0A5S6R5N7_TRIMR